jgi:hypothetical protein
MSPEHDAEISKVGKDNPVIETVIICPGCNNKHIVGGEADYDEVDNRDIIMMFGHDYNEKKHSQLPSFNGIEVKVTDIEIMDFIRKEGLLKLKDRVQIIKIVSDYYKGDVDGNDVNKILKNCFGR